MTQGDQGASTAHILPAHTFSEVRVGPAPECEVINESKKPLVTTKSVNPPPKSHG